MKFKRTTAAILAALILAGAGTATATLVGTNVAYAEEATTPAQGGEDTGTGNAGGDNNPDGNDNQNNDTVQEGLPEATDDKSNIELESKTYKLTDEVSVYRGIEVPSNVNATLDLNGHTLSLKSSIRVNGNLTIKDSSVQSAPVVSDAMVVSYTSGKIISEVTAVIPQNGGSVMLQSGMVESTGGCGIYVNGNQKPEKDNDKSETKSSLTVAGGYIKAQEFGIGIAGRGASVTVNDGVIESLDNATVSGNGTNSDDRYDGGTTININGGTMIGHIQSEKYIACGIYHPQKGTLNINGGTIYVDGGVGVLMRGGELKMSNGSITTTGKNSGRIGDSTVINGCYGILIDGASSYYDHENTSVSVTGGTIKSEMSVLEKLNAVNNKLEVSGGTFSSDPKDYVATGKAVYSDPVKTNNAEHYIVASNQNVGEQLTVTAPATATVEQNVTFTAAFKDEALNGLNPDTIRWYVIEGDKTEAANTPATQEAEAGEENPTTTTPDEGGSQGVAQDLYKDWTFFGTGLTGTYLFGDLTGTYTVAAVAGDRNVGEAKTVITLTTPAPSTPSGGGSTTTTTTTTDPDTGTKTETTTTTNPDGSKTEQKTETETDGTKTETKTETKADGSSTSTSTVTDANGEVLEKTETKLEVKADKSTVETTTTTLPQQEGKIEDVVEKDAEGKVTKQTTTVSSTKEGDLSKVITVEETKENAAGNTVQQITTTSIDESGKTDKITEEHVIENVGNNTNAHVSVEKDGNGTVKNTEVIIDKVGATKGDAVQATITNKVLSQVREAAGDGAENMSIIINVADKNGNDKYTVTVDASALKPNQSLTIYKKNKDGELVMVNNKEYKTDSKGQVKLVIKSENDFVLLTEEQNKAETNRIKKTIALEKTKAKIKTDKTTTMELKDTLDMANVKKITYKSLDKAIATVNKDGKIRGKKAGTVTVQATITLKNGEKKVVKMTLVVKNK